MDEELEVKREYLRIVVEKHRKTLRNQIENANIYKLIKQNKWLCDFRQRQIAY